MGKDRDSVKKRRRESDSSIVSLSTAMSSSPRPPSQLQNPSEMMKFHLNELHKLSKKNVKNISVKVLIEKLVSLFDSSEKRDAERTEEVESKLNSMKIRSEKLESSLQSQIIELRDMVKDLKEKTSELDKRCVSVAPVVNNAFEEGYRLRSLVFSGLQLPTPHHIPNSQKRVHSIKAQVEDVMAFLGIQYPVIDVFQMGLHLVKVRLGCREAVKEVLSRASKLRYSPFERVHIRPSLTAEERAERATNLRNAQHERRERESRGEFVFIKSLPNFLEFSVERRRGPNGRHRPNLKHPNQTRV